ncbi:MAG: YceI family protein [Caldilineales bacterium]|nr:YceI family protein [Caldilineales bacterium]
MTARNIIIIVAVVAIIAVGLILFSVFRTPDDASAPIEAVPISQEATPVSETRSEDAVAVATEAPAAAPAEAEEEPKTAPVNEDGFPQIESPLQAPGAAESPLATPSAGESPLPTPAAEEAAPAPEAEKSPESSSESTGAAASAGPILFTIVPEESEARFRIQEVLRGSDNEVVGITNQAAAEISLDPANPAASQIGVVRVNARTLTTDNNFRNNAIKNRILLTNDFEFVEFNPTAIQGMPDNVTVGEPFSFQVVGDLTVTDETHEVVFDVTVTPVSAERIEGLATVTIAWRDFGLTIPDAPAVDTVADDVTLELQFVAVPKSS